MRNTLKSLLLLNQHGGAVAPSASFTVTTTAPNQTLTINSLGVSASTTVEWGDGQTDDYTGTAQRTHQYAAAGEYTVRILTPENVTTLDIRDSKVTLNSADVKLCVNIVTALFTGLKAGTFDSADVADWRPTNFYLYSMPTGYAGTFDSADVSDWRPAYFYLYSMPAGYAGTFDSADVSAWRPTLFRLYSMPTGYAGTFDSADVSDWRPTLFYLYSMPAGYAGTFNSADVSAWRPTHFYLYSMPTGYTFTLSAGGFAGWISTPNFQMQDNSLLQAQVNQILADFWAGFATRTATGGTINVGGTNAAPSGTLQAANPPTTGKEYAYCLVNDPNNINPTKRWAAVTITA